MEYEEEKFSKKKFETYLCEQMKKIKEDKDQSNPIFDQLYMDWRDIKKKKTLPWVGCANWSVPVTSALTDAITPKIVEGIFDKNPIIDTKAVNTTENDYSDKVKEFIIDWDLSTNDGLMQEIWMFIQNTCIYGTGFNKTSFVKERAVRTNEYSAYVVDGRVIKDQDGTPIPEDERITKAYTEKGTIFEMTDVSETEEYWKKYNPLSKTLDIKKVYWSTDADSIVDAFNTGIVAEEFEETKDNLKRRLKDDPKGLYKNLTKVKIKEIENASDSNNDDDARRKKALAYKTKKITFHEIYCNYDVNDDGFEEKIVAIIHLPTGTLLGYEEFPYDHEKCPIVAGYIKPVHNNVLGIGIPEILYDTKHQIDAEHNARTDRNSLNNNKPMMYTDESGFNVEEHRFGPGRRWGGIKDFNQIKFLDTPDNEINSIKEEEKLWEYAQRRSGQFDNSLGKSDPKNQTATGILALLEEGNIPIRHFIRWISLAIAEIVNQRWALYNQFWGNANDKEIDKWVEEILDSPTNPLGREDKDAFKQKMNIYFTASKESKAQQLAKAQSSYDIALNSPLLQQFPFAVRNLTVDLYRQIGHTNAEEMVPTEQQIMDYQANVQKEAIKKLREERGLEIPQAPTQDELIQEGSIDNGEQ